jgi:hypothetical protein
VAENTDFNYLDSQEEDRLFKAIGKKPFSTLDFLCIIRYQKAKAGKKTPLKSDHYVLRFQFEPKMLQMQVFHEKGLMYVSQKDLPEFATDRVNAEFTKKVLKPLERL